MAFERAVNSETGEVVFLVDNQWVKPTDTAVNDKGEKAYLVSNQWEVPSIAQPKPESGVGTTAADVGKSLASGLFLILQAYLKVLKLPLLVQLEK